MVRELSSKELNAQIDKLSVQVLAQRLEARNDFAQFEKDDRLILLQSIIDLEKEFSKTHANPNPKQSPDYFITDTDLELYQMITVIIVDLYGAKSKNKNINLDEEDMLISNRGKDTSIAGYIRAVEDYSVLNKNK